MHATQATALAVAWEASRAASPVGNAALAPQANAPHTLGSAVSRAATRLYTRGGVIPSRTRHHATASYNTKGWVGGSHTRRAVRQAGALRSHEVEAKDRARCQHDARSSVS